MNDSNEIGEVAEGTKVVTLTLLPKDGTAVEVTGDITLAEWAHMTMEADRELRELPAKPIMDGPTNKTIAISLSPAGEVSIKHDRNLTRGDWFRIYWTIDTQMRQRCMRLLTQNEQRQTQAAQLPAGLDLKRLRQFGS